MSKRMDRPEGFPKVPGLPRVELRTLVRSGFARFPRLYDAASGPLRFEVMSRLHMVGEAEFRALPLLTTRPDPLVLDIGANVGQSLLSTLTVLPRAKVVCFEPNPALHPDLRRLVSRRPTARLEPCGLGSATASLILYTPVYNGHVMPGLSSFDLEAARCWLTPRTLYGFDARKLEIVEATAEVCPLDAFGLAPDVIKIDVQGMEAEVIRGGLGTITRHRPAIIAETVLPDSPAFRLLEPLGYGLMEWNGRSLVPATGRRVNQIAVPPAASPQPTREPAT